MSILFLRHHQSTFIIATQSQGREGKEFILGSPNVLPRKAQCGYLSFNDEIKSDQRTMFIDLKNSLKGTKIKLCNTPSRSTGTQCKLSKTKQNKDAIVGELDTRNIAAKVEESSASKQERAASFLKRLNDIDTQVTDILLRADKKYGSNLSKLQTKNTEINQLHTLLK